MRKYRIAILILAIMAVLSCEMLDPHSARSNSLYADFSSSLGSGLVSTVSGSGSASVENGKLTLASPAITDAALVYKDTEITKQSAFTIKSKFRWTAALGGGEAKAITLWQKASAPSPDTNENMGTLPKFTFDYFDGYGYMLQYEYNTAGNYRRWTGNSSWENNTGWQTTPSLALNTDYVFIFTSAQNGGVWQFNVVVKTGDESSTLIDTGWRDWSDMDAGRSSVWLVIGEGNTTYSGGTIEYEYLNFDDSTPSEPQILTATGQENKITLSWSAPATGTPTGYYIYRCLTGPTGTFTKIATVGNVLTYTDKYLASATYGVDGAQYLFDGITSELGLKPSTQYWYKVSAYNGIGEGSMVAADNTTTSGPSAATGNIRGKHMTYLIMNSTDYGTLTIPTKAQHEALHDYIRTNVTTKITLAISKEVLTSTPNASGTELEKTLQYAIDLVGTYNYDIVTLPHLAWFPAVSPFSEGIATEKTNIDTCHSEVVMHFGKAPIYSMAWAYNHDLVEHAITKGYKVAPNAVKDQISIDAFTSMGIHPYFYRPSKRNTMMPGDGTLTNTNNIVVGISTMSEPTFMSRKSFHSQIGGGYFGLYRSGVYDIPIDFWNAIQGVEDRAVTSQGMVFNKFWVQNDYWDAYWLFNDVRKGADTGYTVGGLVVYENLYCNMRIAEWMKSRYHTGDTPLADYVSASELADYLDSNISLTSPVNAIIGTATLTGDGNVLSGDQSLWWSSREYTSKIHWRTGSGGFVKFVDYIPFSVTNDEPTPPSNDWSNITTGVLRDASTPPLTVKLHIGSDNVTIDGAVAGDNVANIHTPVYSVVGNNVVISWDIYNTGNTERLTHFYIKNREGGFCWGHNNDKVGLTVEASGILSNQICGRETLRRHVLITQ